MTDPLTDAGLPSAEVELERLLLGAQDASRGEVATRAHRLIDAHEHRVYTEAAGQMMTTEQIDQLLVLAEQRQAVHAWEQDERAFARAVRDAGRRHEQRRVEREREQAALDPLKSSDQVWAEAWVSACALADVPPDPDRPFLQEAIDLGHKVQRLMRRRSSRQRPLTAQERELLLGPVRLARQYVERDGRPFDPTAEASDLSSGRSPWAP